MKCKFCNLEKTLVKAHIIPEAFFKGVNKSKKPSKLITNNPSIPPKKSPIGIYDKYLVCRVCEDKFQKVDNYAINFFKQDFFKLEKYEEGKILLGFNVKEFNYELLKLFFISLLWRASESSNEYFLNIQAGPFNNILKNHITSQNPGGIHDFSVMIWRFNDDREIIPMMSPFKTKIDGVTCYNFIFYGFHCIIKVSNLKLSSDFQKALLSPSSSLFIGSRDYKGTAFHDFVVDIARMQKYKVF